MSVLGKLAFALGRRDEVPNQLLAKQLTEKKDKKAIKELVVNLTNKSKAIQNDCIKVLYEIGALNSSLIAEYAAKFVALLESKSNRLQWGAMIAIDAVTLENSKVIYGSLSKILKAADKGSVIANDHAVNILIKLCSNKKYTSKAFPLLIGKLVQSPTNQLPMYAERALPVIMEGNKALFIKALSSRLEDIDKESKRKRVEKVILRLSRK